MPAESTAEEDPDERPDGPQQGDSAIALLYGCTTPESRPVWTGVLFFLNDRCPDRGRQHRDKECDPGGGEFMLRHDRTRFVVEGAGVGSDVGCGVGCGVGLGSKYEAPYTTNAPQCLAQYFLLPSSRTPQHRPVF